MTTNARGVAQAREALCRLDANDRYTFVNDECAAHLGLDVPALLGQSAEAVFPDSAARELRDTLQAARRSGEPQRTAIPSALTGRWVEVDVYPDAGGLLLHLRDLHDRKLNEVRAHRLQAVTEALAGALTLSEVVEVMLEAAVPASDADAGAVLLRTEDGRHLELLGQQGYSPEVASVLTRLPLDANTPFTHAARADEALYLTREQIGAHFPHWPFVASDQHALHVILPLSAGREALGAWQLSFTMDAVLTDQERSFIETLARLAALALARAELYANLERAVERRTVKLHEQGAEMRAYAEAVSRDLAPSLRRIRDFADVLARRLLPHLGTDEARFFEHIQTEGERMARLMDDLGAFVVSGQDAVRYANVPLGQLVEGARADLAPLLRQRSVVWTVRDLPTVRGNGPLLRQTFAALLSNALKSTREREVAFIEVGAERGENEWVVWVRDNGIGFPADASPSLFHAYESMLNSLRGTRDGAAQVSTTNLSLANVRRIVAKHGGTVWAYSEPGEGATFHFSLPDNPRPRGE